MRSTAPEIVVAGSGLVRVAAGTVFDTQGRVLISQRPAHKAYPHRWEFPGGKLHPGEDATTALARELDEELGIAVRATQPLIRIRFRYPQFEVDLDVHRVTAFDGTPRSCEGQALRYVAPEALPAEDLLEGNRAIVTALRLPSIYGITDTVRYGRADMLVRLERALAAGLRLVQVREPGMDLPELARFSAQVRVRCRPFGARCLLNADPQFAVDAGADGVHLNGRRLAQLRSRPLAGDLLVAASCHGDQELARAMRLGADFVVLSPVLRSASHPKRTPLGWDQFNRLSAHCSLPVYALGGMTADCLARARMQGAQGVAMIRGLWDG